MSQVIRAALAAWAVLNDRLYLNLPAHCRPKAAAELDDASLVAWVRWALVNVAKSYASSADEKGRSVSEVTVMHGVVSLALMTLRCGATESTFNVKGVTYCDEPKGDWRVTIEQVDPTS